MLFSRIGTGTHTWCKDIVEYLVFLRFGLSGISNFVFNLVTTFCEYFKSMSF